MRLGFFPKLALTGISKNKRLYIPYILTGVLMICITYILSFMSFSEVICAIPGGSTAQAFMSFGYYVVVIFSLIFLFYTNAFLIKRRKKEFGLYNMLGMGKKGLGRILFWENVFMYIIALFTGLFAGILLSKLVELVIINLLNGQVNFSFKVCTPAIVQTTIAFLIIFCLLYLNGLRQVRFAGAIELVQSEKAGEKAPKANWLLGILGFLILAAAYGIALKIKEPLEALAWFFVAVILVIIATYLIFIAGSVLICKIMQRNKNYYYKAEHFVSVSSMSYRMKRNGAGLASICILLTMVLVMVSSTCSLFLGEDECIAVKCPKDICIRAYRSGYDADDELLTEASRASVDSVLDAKGITKSDVLNYHEYRFTGYYEGGIIDIDPDTVNSISVTEMNYSSIMTVHMISLDEYNEIYGLNETLADHECLIYQVKTSKFDDSITIGSETYQIKGETVALGLDDSSENVMSPNVFMVVDELDAVAADYKDCLDGAGDNLLCEYFFYQFNTGLSDQENWDLMYDIKDAIASDFDSSYDYYYVDDIGSMREDFVGTFGGLLFIGLLLSLVFLTAAVLIIYYKQISEGYEDQNRFEIMQKVGMTKKAIRKSINSQMITVFLAPIAFSILHIIFAFPFILKLLQLFSLFNVKLLALTTICSVLLAAVFYLLVYKITSNAYFNIVSEGRE